MEQDIRWRQQFSNFEKAFGQLSEFIEKGNLNKFEQQGLIQAFEYTYEIENPELQDQIQRIGKLFYLKSN